MLKVQIDQQLHLGVCFSLDTSSGSNNNQGAALYIMGRSELIPSHTHTTGEPMMFMHSQ